MWKMPAKERIQTRIVAATAVKRVLDFRHQLSVCPVTHTEDVRVKRNIHRLLCSNHFLNYRNVAKHIWREPQIIKFENAFHIWINIGYICERTLSAMLRVKSRVCARLTDCNLHITLCCYSFRAEFHKIGPLPTASGIRSRGAAAPPGM